jgi:hypothetical protein
MKSVILIIVVAFSLLILSGCTTTEDYYGLKLVNNSQAKNVSSSELLQFLKQDPTNEHEIIEYTHKGDYYVMSGDNRYVGYYDLDGKDKVTDETLTEYVTSGYQCMNFAVDLHNNAEASGIRCAVVISPMKGHCFNAFETTDWGLVYVDAWANSDCLSQYDIIRGLVIPNCRYRHSDNATNEYWTEFLGDTSKFEVTW